MFFGVNNLCNPWCTIYNIFLLYDFMGLIKSVCKNWLAKKCQEQYCTFEGSVRTAKWSDLKKIQFEKDTFVKLFKLNETDYGGKNGS